MKIKITGFSTPKMGKYGIVSKMLFLTKNNNNKKSLLLAQDKFKGLFDLAGGEKIKKAPFEFNEDLRFLLNQTVDLDILEVTSEKDGKTYTNYKLNKNAIKSSDWLHLPEDIK